MSSGSGNLDDLLFHRRSIRKFKPDDPPGEWIESMVLCGARAPSPSNSQPVRFVRIMSNPAKEKLRDALAEGRRLLLLDIAQGGGAKRARNYVNSYFRFSEFMFAAPVLMCLGTDTGAAGLRGPADNNDSGRRRRDLDITVGLAAKGYLLKGEDLGLASCIMTAPLLYLNRAGSPEEILGIECLDIRCFIVSGLPDEEPAHLDRKPVSEVYRIL